jgi:hypothetical protein
MEALIEEESWRCCRHRTGTGVPVLVLRKCQAVGKGLELVLGCCVGEIPKLGT